jgi:UDP-glucose 4-epimerase
VENLAAVVTARPVARVAFMSSAAVYGEETHNTSIRESTQVNPTSYYGIAKFTAECLLKKALSFAPAPSLVCFRPPLVYGPGDRGKTYGPAGFCASIHEGTPITLWGDGSEQREFLFIDDLCRMIRHVTLGDFQGSVNLVSGKSHSFQDVIECLRSISPAPFEVNRRDRSKRQVDNAFDATLIHSLLPPDFAFTPLEEGVRMTFDFFQ